MWGLGAALWFAAVSVAWGWYFERRQSDVEDRKRSELQVSRLAEVNRRATLGPLPAGPSVSRERLMTDLTSLAFERFTDEGRKRARALLSHRLTALGFQPELQAFNAGVNIVGERPGAAPDAGDAGDAGGPGPGVILLAAHFDTVEASPGANDNATGLAAALEMARLFQTPATRHALRIAFFDREEAGMLGSRTYARWPERTAGIRAVLVLEMLGATCTTPGCQKVPEDFPFPAPSPTGDFLAAVGNDVDPALLPLIMRAARPGLPRVFGLPVLDGGRDLPDTRRSDHAPFWDAGLPAVMLTDTANLRSPRYHSADDVAEAVDADFFVGNAQTVANALAALLDGPAGH